MEGDIVDLLLKLKKEKSTPIDLTFDDIKGIIMNMLVGGTDTSTAAVIRAMTALIRNPNAMKKVQAEIRESVGKKSIVTFRLYPPAPLLLPRETMKNSILEGYEIKQKTIIHVNIWTIARDPEIWENLEEFIPERFLNSDIDFKGQTFELLPFGAGRRRFPGVALGVATVELVLSNLLYAFDWELPSGMRREDIDTDVLPGLAMHKKNALCLVPTNYH
ncbi:Cytochrome [Capsicum baccatum]|uniref:Cytochrome n=1 Tax=Capsicum baccatum TaxID=33114 RepID=A0A2G2W289_CAPBA|nr:Cytochrome [Capsicum baccatum]